MLSHIKDEAEISQVLEMVIANYATILDLEVKLACSAPQQIQQQLEGLLNLLKSKQVTMEVITNMAYVEEG